MLTLGVSIFDKNYMNVKIKNTVFAGLAAALICVLSVCQIPLPTGVPLTLQTFAVAFCGYSLGLFQGSLATLAYIGVGFVGLPVFSGFMGGAAVLLGPTGGFIIGFLPLCALCALGCGKKMPVALSFGAVGLLICHFLGVLRYCFVMNCSALTALLSVSLAYILKDAALEFFAYYLSRPVRKMVSGYLKTK